MKSSASSTVLIVYETHRANYIVLREQCLIGSRRVSTSYIGAAKSTLHSFRSIYQRLIEEIPLLFVVDRMLYNGREAKVVFYLCAKISLEVSYSQKARYAKSRYPSQYGFVDSHQIFSRKPNAANWIQRIKWSEFIE